MSAAGGRAQRRVRWPRPRRWRHWTLRSRLALVAAALSAVALIAANSAGLVLLESYLIDRVDSQLTTVGSSAEGIDQRRIAQFKRAAQGASGDVQELMSKRFNGNTRLYVLAANGKVSDLLPAEAAGPGPDLTGDVAGHAGGGPFTVGGEDGGTDWRLYVHPTATGSDGDLLVTAASLETVADTYDRLLLIDVSVMVVVLALLGVASALVVRVGLRPLTKMEATAGQITAGDFSPRVADVDARTEPGRLGAAMNAMLGRVETEITARRASEQRLRRFLADASHELRTPLTSIRGFAELFRRGGDGQDAMRRIEAEAARMGVLVEDLLLLARLDEQREVERRPVDLLELAADVLRDLHARSPQRVVHLSALGEGGGLIEPVVVHGDPLRLRQVLGNLLANADQHTPADAEITVRLGSACAGAQGPIAAAAGTGPAPGAPAAVVEVADTGPGVPDRHAPHIFERLYRADAARSGGGGSGLGLAIAAALMGLHGGRIELAAAAGSGATFRMVLPLAVSRRATPRVL